MTQTRPRDIFDWVITNNNNFQDGGVTTIFITEILTNGDFSKSPDQLLETAAFDRKHQRKHFTDKQICFSDIKYANGTQRCPSFKLFGYNQQQWHEKRMRAAYAESSPLSSLKN